MDTDSYFVAEPEERRTLADIIFGIAALVLAGYYAYWLADTRSGGVAGVISAVSVVWLGLAVAASKFLPGALPPRVMQPELRTSAGELSWTVHAWQYSHLFIPLILYLFSAGIPGLLNPQSGGWRSESYVFFLALVACCVGVALTAILFFHRQEVTISTDQVTWQKRYLPGFVQQAVIDDPIEIRAAEIRVPLWRTPVVFVNGQGKQVRIPLPRFRNARPPYLGSTLRLIGKTGD